SVLLVNRDASTLDWGIYIILAYLVASILFIPKLWGRKKDLLTMISSPFKPETSLERVLSIRQALSGVPLDPRDYKLLRVGTCLSGFRGYSKLILSRLSGESHEIFQSFISAANNSSFQIADSIGNEPLPVELESVDREIANIQKSANLKESTVNAALEVAQDVRSLLARANELLVMNDTSTEKVKISSPRNSLREVLGANFNLNNMYIRHALRFTLAMTIGLLIVYLTRERDAIWITMGILIIIKPDVTSTINNMIVRVSFNVVAILLAIALGFIFPPEILLGVALLMLFLFRAFYPTYMGLSVMAMTVLIVLIWPNGTVFENATARLIDISIGAAIAFICAYVILPSRLTVNLPEQIANTIRATREYANTIIPSEEHEYDHDKAVKSFRKYILEEKNLESAIKKVQDSFDDVSDDFNSYNQIKATNRKLAADLSAFATLIEKSKSHPDISESKEEITIALNELAFSIEKDVILPKARFNKLESDEDSLPENIFNYLKWIISDIKFIQEEVEQASRTGALKRYRKMT
ncbi:MAG: FUSC family protein, partial [Methanobacteriaceae archaeon]|nr:FUSC family protein [Methanobacteriaceae archaeon]